ncbi:MAG: carboxylesterase family protein [Prevotella sp.]|nr:carboxylesterase family protein [Prevotella sp.]
MFDQHIQEDLIYMMLYAAVATMSLMASCYLLFRRANAIAPDVTSSVRLRRWTAAFFASMTLSHLWFLPIAFLTSAEDIMLSYLLGAIKMSECQTMGGGKSYTYFYRVESSNPILKSAHFEEIPIVFAHLEHIEGRQYDATFSKTMRKMWVQFAKTGNPSLTAEQSPTGKAIEWPLYDLGKKQVMVLDQFDIHPARESEVKIVDWNKSYFLTKYYML